MGSFNTKCCASGQTIATGDPCIVVAIRQQSTYKPIEMNWQGNVERQFGFAHSICYPTCFWAPVSPFFEAEYNDYGDVVLRESRSNLEKLLRFIEDALMNTPVLPAGAFVENEPAYDLITFLRQRAPLVHKWVTYGSAPENGEPDSVEEAEDFEFDGKILFSQAALCWGYIFNTAQAQQRLFWRSSSDEARPLSFAVIHADAWQQLVAVAEQDGYAGEPAPMRKVFDTELAQIKAELQKLDEEHAGDDLDRQIALKLPVFIGLQDVFQRFARFGVDFPGEVEQIVELASLFLANELTEAELFDELKPWLEARYACEAMQALNLHFEPLSFADQDYSNTVGARYSEFVGKVSATAVRRRVERSLGTLRTYQISVADLNVFKALDQFCRQYDCRTLVTQAKPDAARPGLWCATFECPTEESTLRDVLLEFQAKQPDGGLLLETLTQLLA